MEEIDKQLNNPVSSIWSLDFQSNFVFSDSRPSDRERWSYNLNFQPVLPLRLTEGWNLVTRPVLPVLARVDVPHVSACGLAWTEKSERLRGHGRPEPPVRQQRLGAPLGRGADVHLPERV